MRLPSLCALVAVTLCAILLSAGLAVSDTASPSKVSLNPARWFSLAVPTEQGIYILGGRLDPAHTPDSPGAAVTPGFPVVYTDQVVFFDFNNGTTSIVERLPFALGGACGASVGNDFYIFGGHTDFKSISRKVLKWNPSSGATTLQSEVPNDTYGCTAAQLNGRIYVFTEYYRSNGQGSDRVDDILVFDPATGRLQTLHSNLQQTRSDIAFSDRAAISDGRDLYLLGERGIGKFNPQTASFEGNVVQIPGGTKSIIPVWQGSSFYLFTPNVEGYGSKIYRYLPGAAELTLMSAALPYKVASRDVGPSAPAACAPVACFIFGGLSAGPSGWDVIAPITKYTLEPGPLASLQARAGPDVGVITVDWRAPSDNTYSNISGYRVYDTEPAEIPSVELPNNTMSHKVTSLARCVTHSFRVSAFNAYGEGPKAGPAKATTPDVPTAPTGLQAVMHPKTRDVTVSWGPPANDCGLPVLRYNVYRSGAGETESRRAAVENNLRFVEPGSTDLFYRATAVNEFGESPHSTRVAVKLPVPPTAAFNVTPERPGVGEPVRFLSTSTAPDSTIVRTVWDFGDGSSDTSPLSLQTFSKSGVYKVTLTIVDNYGVSASTEKFVNVGNALPALEALPFIGLLALAALATKRRRR